MSEPDPLTVDLDTLPLQPQRWMYVLSLILRRHNWQHADKAKGVSHRTNEARARLCIWVFASCATTRSRRSSSTRDPSAAGTSMC